MTNEEKSWVELTHKLILEKFKNESSGHDFWHVVRVVGLAQHLHEKEGGDLFMILMTAWLHDIADWKFHQGDLHKGPAEAHRWMSDLAIPENQIDAICHTIKNLSYKGAQVQQETLSLEGKIVQDADRLDAMGAIGIARTFAYGGHVGSAMYEPSRMPTLHHDAQAYVQDRSHTINHFYEKLLLLKDRMHTATARQLAEVRHQRLQTFLQNFMEEWVFAVATA